MTDAVETEEIDYTYANGKPATPLQRRFAEWLQGEEVGYNPASAKSKAEAFAEGVRYAVALRIPYQASAHNREATAIEREEREAERARTAQERLDAKAQRAEAAKEKAAKSASSEEPKPKAAKTAKPKAAPAATPATAPATGRRPAARRAPARAAAPSSDAPF